jgi:CxxC motif-containing protein (DUF1111 family)
MKRQLLLILLTVSSLHGVMAQVLTREDAVSAGLIRSNNTTVRSGYGQPSGEIGHQDFLHDGSARTLQETLIWHGGEAEASKEFVRTLSQDERDKLIKFLESL